LAAERPTQQSVVSDSPSERPCGGQGCAVHIATRQPPSDANLRFAARRRARMKNLNEKMLFWASFLTLIAAGMGFAIRGEILVDWGAQFGFTQTELGEIQGMGLVGFGFTIIFFSFFADVVGYGKLMIIAFVLHILAVALTLIAPVAYGSGGKTGAFWSL